MEEVDLDLCHSKDKKIVGYGISYPYMDKNDICGYINYQNNGDVLNNILNDILQERGIQLNVFFAYDTNNLKVSDIEIVCVDVLSKKCTQELQNRYYRVNNLANKGIQKAKNYSVKLRKIKKKSVKIDTSGKECNRTNIEEDTDINLEDRKDSKVFFKKRKKKNKTFKIDT